MSAHACVAETPTVGGSSVRSGYRQALTRTTSTHGTGPSRRRPKFSLTTGAVRDGLAAGWTGVRRWCCHAQGRSRLAVVLLPLSQAGQGSAAGGKRVVGAADV